jgi:hypothetical protein
MQTHNLRQCLKLGILNNFNVLCHIGILYCVENGEVESMIKFQHEIDPHLFRKERFNLVFPLAPACHRALPVTLGSS